MVRAERICKGNQQRGTTQTTLNVGPCVSLKTKATRIENKCNKKKRVCEFGATYSCGRVEQTSERNAIKSAVRKCRAQFDHEKCPFLFPSYIWHTMRNISSTSRSYPMMKSWNRAQKQRSFVGTEENSQNQCLWIAQGLRGKTVQTLCQQGTDWTMDCGTR